MTIDVLSDGSPVVGQMVSVGDEATASGFTSELVAIDLDTSAQDGGQPGGDETTVWILPK